MAIARSPRPERRVGIRHVLRRVRNVARPAVTITPPPTDGVVLDRDVEVVVRDGTTLRANVFRSAGEGRHPVLISAHPYGKDALPRARRRGGWSPPRQYRLMPQSTPVVHSAWTSWEAPDPAVWVPRGFVVVNADLRGWGRSEGTGELLSAQEAEDYHDLVEWAAARPWSDGRVIADGVSYLAIAQWGLAATRPPHLVAVCPWEGFTDLYEDFARTGGVPEDGFLRLWTTLLRAQRRSPVDLLRQQRARPCDDDWWAARRRPIEDIDVPVLVCGSFSDHNLHSRGSFEGFRRAGSSRRRLYTHRGPKWSTYYSEEATEARARFYDEVLGRPAAGAATPPVRLEVRSDARTVTSVRHVADWPPPGTTWTPRYLGPDGALAVEPPGDPGIVGFDLRRGSASFRWRFPTGTEVVGPMWVRLHVELVGVDDAELFVGVDKLAGGRVVGFEGSYGFDAAQLTQGRRRVSHRGGTGRRSAPWIPVVDHSRQVPAAPGEVVALEVELAPSATWFDAGDEIALQVSGRWAVASNPLTGQFPARYGRSRRGAARLHLGAGFDSALHVPTAG